MDSQKVDMFIMAKGKYFERHELPMIREKLLATDEAKWPIITTAALKEPTTSIILSVIVGHFGVDRFYIGDTGLGVGKLLTCGGFGIWTIVDWFLIMGATREKNAATLQK